MGLKRIMLCAAFLATLEGCSARLAEWSAEIVSVDVAMPVPITAPQSPRCRPLPQTVAVEAVSETPIDAIRTGGPEALSAALIASEARKNYQLKAAIDAYEMCRNHLEKSNAIY